MRYSDIYNTTPAEVGWFREYDKGGHPAWLICSYLVGYPNLTISTVAVIDDFGRLVAVQR